MDKHIEDIIGLFHKDKPVDYTVNGIRLEDSDSRWVVYACFPEGKYVIKLACNGFTTEERVSGWAGIIAEYGKLGYYSPALRKSLAGKYAERAVFRGKQCVVWEEEFAKYNFRSALDKSVYVGEDGRYVYHDEVFEFVGRVAQKRFTNFPYKSGWVRLEPFGADETMDEVSECVETFDALVRKKAPGFIPRWEKLRALFEENKARLAAVYPDLPTSVFQGDAFETNLLLDDEGHFKGVIDYNLAGEDTAVNVFLYMIVFGYSYDREHPDGSGALFGLNKTTADSVLAIIRRTLRFLRKYYTFSGIEADAAPLLYKYITCIEYAHINALEKYAGDDGKLAQLFDFMEFALSREDIDFREAMLG